MDSKCKLSKTETIKVSQLIEQFILDDPKINLYEIQHNIENELKEKLQKDFEEKMNITPEIKNWLEQQNLKDVSSIYYTDKCYSYKHKYNNCDDFRIYDFTNREVIVKNTLITVYTYHLSHRYCDKHFEHILSIYEEVFDKYIEDFNEKLETYQKLKKDMIIVLNQCKTAQKVLEKFGFIESINKYINTLLSAQAKPISCMTQAVENSVDNYLKQRKELDEQKK